MARSTHHQPQHQGCAPDCTYRGLYEGTQASLADMARRQTEALRRVGRLRSAIVLLLKRHFPLAFSQAETNLGSRLSETDDEVLLAYLTGFVGNNPSGSSEQHILLLRKVAGLKAELALLGIHLVGDDPQSWAENIRTWQAQQNKEAASGSSNSSKGQPTPSTREYPSKVSHSSHPLTNQEQPRGQQEPRTLAQLDPMVAPRGDSPRLADLFEAKQEDGKPIGHSNEHNPAGSALGDLFGDTTPGNGRKVSTLGISDRETSSKDEVSSRTLGDIFSSDDSPKAWPNGIGEVQHDQSGRWVPSPLQPRQVINPFFPATDQSNSAIPVVSSGKTVVNSDGPSRATELDSVNHDSQSGTRTQGSSVEIDPVEWVNPFDAPPGEAPDYDIKRETPPANHEEESSQFTPTSGVELAPGIPETFSHRTQNDASEFHNGPESGGRQTSSPTPLTASALTAGTDIIPQGTSQSNPGMTQPLRPELFPITKPARTNRRGTKTPRARAERPDPHLLDVPIEYPETSELTAETRQKLLASSLLPRPIFTSDLIAVAGSADAVAAWETELRADPANSPVRFLAAKGRHRLRGSLIIPVNEGRDVSKGSKSSWWVDCVNLYRGSRLYELGVVLNRVGDEIVAARFDEHVAVLRLSSPRGLVGVVVTFDTNSGEEPTKTAVRETLEQLLKERLTLIAVLTSAGEATAVTNLTETVASLALSEDWKRTIPVIAARSWEFADDRGSTAQLVFGG